MINKNILAVLLYIFAGLVIKTEGKIYGIYRVDLFHYVISIANILFIESLKQLFSK